jgi:L-alanine-DL-glutamate epimerase-like enolase superfamily enzyme
MALPIPVRETPKEYGTILVTIETDTGLRGVGLARPYDKHGLAIRHVVMDDLAPYLATFDPLPAPGRVWHEACFELRGTYYRYPTGVLSTAMGAVDQALWDLRGQELGEPVYRLLGGAQDEIDVYATFGLNIYTPDEETEAAIRVKAKGFTAFKLQGVDDRGGKIDLAAARVRRLREAVGDDAHIIIDAHLNYVLHEAIELAKAVAPYNVAYIDEPLIARDPPALKRLHDAGTGVRFAARSRGGSLLDNRDLIASGGIDFLGQNVIDQGGYTQSIKAAHLAELSQLPVVTGGAWHLQNSHLIAAVTNGWMSEYHAFAAQFCDALFVDPIQPSGGRLRMGDRPGLGLVLNDEAVAEAKARGAALRRG